jgi:hypothetical protein
LVQFKSGENRVNSGGDDAEGTTPAAANAGQKIRLQPAQKNMDQPGGEVPAAQPSLR